MYYDRSGKSISPAGWAKLFGNYAYKVIEKTDVTDEIEVSTVWLGLNHGYSGGAPIIFETMVFGGPLDEECERYCTEEEAVKGHAVMVARAGEAMATARRGVCL